MEHTAIIRSAPVFSGRQSVPDGAYNGNGDMGIVLGSFDKGLRIYLSKIDLWYAREEHNAGGLRPLGVIDIPIDKELYKNYYAEQRMNTGELFCRLSNGINSVELIIRTAKTENAVMIECSGNMTIKPFLHFAEDIRDGDFGIETIDDMTLVYRIFNDEYCMFKTECYSVLRRIDEGLFILCAATNHNTANPREKVICRAAQINKKEYNNIKNKHYGAWNEFWSKSKIECSDRDLETRWYAGLYYAACCSGSGEFAPGLYGNFVTVETPGWKSDYHLNYNYQAPFYHVFSSNHPELADCYDAPLEAFLEKGKEFANYFGAGGILYPVAVGPKGMLTEKQTDISWWFTRLFLGQKSNAIHPADIMVFRWNATKDLKYAKCHAYPYIKQCLQFFEDYAVFRNGKCYIKQDAAHEVPYYITDFNERKYKRYINDTNNQLTLGLLRMCIPAAVEMSEALGMDDEKRTEWLQFLSKLTKEPVCIRKGKKVFRYTEKGQRWNHGNDVGLQHIFPAGAVTLNSNAKLLKLARETYRQKMKNCRLDDNAASSFFPMGARLGMQPEWITESLRLQSEKKGFPNLLYNYGGGGTEYYPIVTTTLNEMALQGINGIIRLFPCWDNSLDFRFENLRADGAFLVSSSIKKGVIGETRIVSEKGSRLRLVNPFPKTEIITDGIKTSYTEKVVEINTYPGQKIIINKK